MYTEMVKRFDELFKQNIEIKEELAKLSAKEVALEIKSVADDLGWEIEIKRESISMYNKMKTDGKPKYVDGVISQVERTLRTLNKAIQDLRVEKLLADKKFTEANEELDILKSKLSQQNFIFRDTIRFNGDTYIKFSKEEALILLDKTDIIWNNDVTNEIIRKLKFIGTIDDKN